MLTVRTYVSDFLLYSVECVCPPPSPVQISVIDAGGVGDVVETFPVASDTITCIAAVPEFDEQDPEVLASECTSYSS